MALIIPVEEFVSHVVKKQMVLIDTRSEKEYEKAHVPGALNLPLLKNEERAEVGTIYKQKGRVEAVKRGFELVGPRFASIISQAEKLVPDRNAMVYCWRGGMRSNIIAWLLQMAGFRVTLLKGGYKSYRNWALNIFSHPRNILVLGGKTGSGKTEMILALEKSGQYVIDLEGIANHKGSAFGSLGQKPQPSNEHFENQLALLWSQCPEGKVLWLENESRSIGSNILPKDLYEQLRMAPVIEIILPMDIRKKRILHEYGIFPIEALVETTGKIAKRLGGLRLKESVAFLESNNFEGWVSIMLEYYDQAYQHSNEQRHPSKIYPVELPDDLMDNQVRLVLDTATRAIQIKDTNN